MALNEPLLMEWDMEMAGTRKSLERAPWDKAGWKPHPRSWSLGQLATHVARLPGWAKETLEQESLDLSAANYAELEKIAESSGALVALFERNAAAGRAAIAAADDAAFMKPWSLKRGDTVYFTLPRLAVLRSFVFNHGVHHRAQLGVYLRMLDVPVPGLYGPSADEGRV